MKFFLIILSILWLAYRLTPLNGIINGYLYNQFEIDLEYTFFDTDNFSFSALFATDEIDIQDVKVEWYRNRRGDFLLVDVDITQESTFEKSVDRYYNRVFLVHNLVTFIPVIVLVGISLAL